MFRALLPRRAQIGACTLVALGFGAWSAPAASAQQVAPPRVVGWNDLGMHCLDPDFSVFSILPPYNTQNAQLIVNEQLVTSGVHFDAAYAAALDPNGSINTSSIGKTNFWDHVQALFGVNLPLDVGLAGNAMPGAANAPQSMTFDPAWNWFHGEGIPLTPIDDAGAKQPYVLLSITARNDAGQLLASTVSVAPVSAELACDRCHASGASPFARPAVGWVFDPDPARDNRLNILQLHDDRQLGDPTFDAALAQAGYDPAGLFATATTGGTAILCDLCHGSNALPGTGLPGISAMTVAMHELHGAQVNELGQVLDDVGKRTSCYVCHPGVETQCLRGAMGKAVGPDGDFAMSCQSCHQSMAAVGDPARVGWLEEPSCQNCHTGTATNNNGQIRYTSAYDTNGELRVPASQAFATTPDVPAAGFSLYRFSRGHGGLQCSACHGPPHAIYPTSEANDNLQSIQIQGHEGTLVDCSACHSNLEDNELIGAHGMHPTDQAWASGKHADVAEQNGLATCRACHGVDYKGTVLSRAQGNRTFSTQFGTKTFFRGAQVGCYHCHNGPNSENQINNGAPSVPDLALSTPADVELPVTLTGTDPQGQTLTFRVVDQAAHGKVAFDGQVASYRADEGYQGPDGFDYAAFDGFTNSNLGHVDVDVTPPLCGSQELYGFGCPGTGGFLPTLTVTGCAEPGGALTLTVDGGLAGAKVLFLRGNKQAIRELQPGCVLRVAPATIMGTQVLAGSGAGDGTASFAHQLPQGAGVHKRTFQAFIRDKGTGKRGVFTNAVEVDW